MEFNPQFLDKETREKWFSFNDQLQKELIEFSSKENLDLEAVENLICAVYEKQNTNDDDDDNSVELNDNWFFTGIWFGEGDNENGSKFNWMLFQWIDENNFVRIGWRMHHFNVGDEIGKQSWYGVTSKEKMTPEEAYEHAVEICEGVKQESITKGMKFYHLVLKCKGSEVFDKILAEAPWLPIIDPWEFAVKNRLR